MLASVSFKLRIAASQSILALLFAVGQLNKLSNLLGTPRDSEDLRSQLRNLQESSSALIRETSNALKKVMNITLLGRSSNAESPLRYSWRPYHRAIQVRYPCVVNSKGSSRASSKRRCSSSRLHRRSRTDSCVIRMPSHLT